MKKLISLTSVLSALIGLLIFQQSFLDYYYRVNMRSSVNGGLIDSKEYKMFKGQVISSTNPQKTLDALTKDAQDHQVILVIKSTMDDIEYSYVAGLTEDELVSNFMLVQNNDHLEWATTPGLSDSPHDNLMYINDYFYKFHNIFVKGALLRPLNQYYLDHGSLRFEYFTVYADTMQQIEDFVPVLASEYGIRGDGGFYGFVPEMIQFPNASLITMILVSLSSLLFLVLIMAVFNVRRSFVIKKAHGYSSWACYKQSILPILLSSWLALSGVLILAFIFFEEGHFNWVNQIFLKLLFAIIGWVLFGYLFLSVWLEFY